MTNSHSIVNTDDEIRDFSSPRRSIKFRVDDDVFEASPDVAAELVLEYADKAEQLEQNDVKPGQQRDLVHSLFRMLLFPESADRFIARLSDPEHPIGHRKITEITQWLFEEYGLRPTGSDSASSTGSENQDAGTSSTEDTSDAVLT